MTNAATVRREKVQRLLGVEDYSLRGSRYLRRLQMFPIWSVLFGGEDGRSEDFRRLVTRIKKFQ